MRSVRRHLARRAKATARLDVEVSAGWASPSSRGLRGGHALLLSTGAGAGTLTLPLHTHTQVGGAGAAYTVANTHYVAGPSFPTLNATAGRSISLALRLADNAHFHVPAANISWEFDAGELSPAARYAPSLPRRLLGLSLWTSPNLRYGPPTAAHTSSMRAQACGINGGHPQGAQTVVLGAHSPCKSRKLV
jgi:hypothetical protein